MDANVIPSAWKNWIRKRWRRQRQWR